MDMLKDMDKFAPGMTAPSPVLVCDDGIIKVSMSFTNFRSVPPYAHTNSKRDYELRIENGCLTGPARDEGGRYMAIGLDLSISPTHGLTYDPVLEQRIRSMGDKVEAVWKNPTPAAAVAPGIKPR